MQEKCFFLHFAQGWCFCPKFDGQFPLFGAKNFWEQFFFVGELRSE